MYFNDFDDMPNFKNLFIKTREKSHYLTFPLLLTEYLLLSLCSLSSDFGPFCTYCSTSKWFLLYKPLFNISTISSNEIEIPL